MKISVKKFAFSCGIIWAAAICFVSVANLVWPEYGVVFLSLVASIYPGYEAMQGIGNVIVGTLYALVDASIGGAIFAWLYNALPE